MSELSSGNTNLNMGTYNLMLDEIDVSEKNLKSIWNDQTRTNEIQAKYIIVQLFLGFSLTPVYFRV